MFEKIFSKYSGGGNKDVNERKALQRAKSVDCDYSTTIKKSADSTPTDVAGNPVVLPRKKRPKSLRLIRKASILVQTPPLTVTPENNIACTKQPVTAVTSAGRNEHISSNIGKVIYYKEVNNRSFNYMVKMFWWSFCFA